MVSTIDESIGMVEDKLKYLDISVIVLMADNGAFVSNKLDVDTDGTFDHMSGVNNNPDEKSVIVDIAAHRPVRHDLQRRDLGQNRNC